jgi:ribonuclease D
MEKVLRPIGARARWFERTDEWLMAIEGAIALPESEWPLLRAQSDGPPPVKVWREKFPAKYAPLTHARAAIEAKSAELSIPAENLISPEVARRVIWDPPAGSTTTVDVEGVERSLRERGARRWQAEIIAPLLAPALLETVPLVLPEPAPEEPTAEV